MNQQDYIQRAAAILADNRDQEIHISIRELWILIGLLRLALRHPQISDYMRLTGSDMAAQFEGGIIAEYPDARELFALAHDPQQDENGVSFNDMRVALRYAREVLRRVEPQAKGAPVLQDIRRILLTIDRLIT